MISPDAVAALAFSFGFEPGKEPGVVEWECGGENPLRLNIANFCDGVSDRLEAAGLLTELQSAARILTMLEHQAPNIEVDILPRDPAQEDRSG